MLEKLASEGIFKVTNDSERSLALTMLRLQEQIDFFLDELQPNKLCDLLYDMAVKVGEFYNQSKVIGSEEEKSRLVLLHATKKVMK